MKKIKKLGLLKLDRYCSHKSKPKLSKFIFHLDILFLTFSFKIIQKKLIRKVWFSTVESGHDDWRYSNGDK